MRISDWSSDVCSSDLESFLPEVLQAQLREVRIDDGHGGRRPLLLTEQPVLPNRLLAPPATPPDLRLPLALAGLLLAMLIALCRRWWPTGYAVLGKTGRASCRESVCPDV